MLTAEIVLARLGAALLEIQDAEKALKIFMACHVRHPGLAWEDIVRQGEGMRAQTLGRVVSELRRTIYVAEHFEERLIQFVKDRNVFVHDLESVPNVAETPEGLQAFDDFVRRVAREAREVGGVMTGLMKILRGEADFQKGIVKGPGVDDEDVYELGAIGAFLQWGLDDDCAPVSPEDCAD